MFLIVFTLCFLVGIIKLDCYVLGERINADIISSEFDNGVAKLNVVVSYKNRTVKGYYSDIEAGQVEIHKLGNILTTKIDVPTSFLLMIIGGIGDFYLLYKLTVYQVMKKEEEENEKSSNSYNAFSGSINRMW